MSNSNPLRRRPGQLAMLLLLLLVAGCAARGDRAARGMDRVPMVVENQNFHRATIYAILNASRIRVGNVEGNSTATLSSPSPPTGQMRVEVRLLAVGAYTSYPVSVVPGDTIRVTVPPNLHLYRGRR